jgi:hypothetical protein
VGGWLSGVGALVIGTCGGNSEPPVIEPTPSAPQYCPFNRQASEAIDVRSLVGMAEAAGVRRAADYGCELAVIERDGDQIPLPDDARSNRASVVVNDDIITGLRGGG